MIDTVVDQLRPVTDAYKRRIDAMHDKLHELEANFREAATTRRAGFMSMDFANHSAVTWINTKQGHCVGS